MKASDLFVKQMEEEGVEYIFTVPGEENLDLLESLRNSSIKVITNRHEQTSAFMAATYGRLTGRAGVCMATLGPGATNLITGIAHAHLGGMPLVAITGQKAIREKWQANFQVLDIVHMMTPITKHAVQIRGPKSIPKEVREAFKWAEMERQGACHIELPEDVASEKVEEKKYNPQKRTQIRRPVADTVAVARAAEQIRHAKNPIIIVSNNGQRNSVRKALQKFVEQTGLYVIHTQLGKGVLGDDHPNSLYAFGIHKKDYVNCVVEKADLIITIGYTTVEHPPSIWNRELNKTILHIDFNAAYHDIYYAPECELVGDIGTSLDMLGKELTDYIHKGEYEQKTKEKLNKVLFEEGAEDDNFPTRPRRIVSDVRKVLGHDDILALDNGIYKMWFSRHYPTYNIGTFLLDNTLASMGAGLPMGMTAKLLNPKKKVLVVTGDGGLIMGDADFETAVRLKLNVVVLIVNDNGYGFIKWKQQNHGFKNFALDYTNPDFVKYAESFGAKGYKINKTEELIPTLKKAFKQSGPVIIDLPIDYSENKKVWSEELGGMVCDT
ncbi:MAG: acetolactate synthase large subunit [Candidatus Nanoarchaeia archaeon]